MIKSTVLCTKMFIIDILFLFKLSKLFTWKLANSQIILTQHNLFYKFLKLEHKL